VWTFIAREEKMIHFLFKRVSEGLTRFNGLISLNLFALSVINARNACECMSRALHDREFPLHRPPGVTVALNGTRTWR